MSSIEEKSQIKKAISYRRVSTLRQVEASSLDTQLSNINTYASENKILIIRDYCDAGITGTSVEERPEYQAMLEDALTNPDIAFVIVYAIDRFGRNAETIYGDYLKLKAAGKHLISLTEEIDQTSPDNLVYEAAQEAERGLRKIHAVTAAGKRARKEAGFSIGGSPPYGYSISSRPGELTVDARRAEQVRVIFEQYGNTDMGVDRLCGWLLDNNVLEYREDGSRTPFQYETIREILANQRYMGMVSSDGTSIIGKHEPIISAELFEKVQKKRRANSQQEKTSSVREYMLSGLIRCPVCDNVGFTGCRIGQYVYYRCKHRNSPSATEGYISVRAKKIDSEILDVLIDLMNNEKTLVAMADGEDETTGLQKAGKFWQEWPTLSDEEQKVYVRRHIKEIVLHSSTKRRISGASPLDYEYLYFGRAIKKVVFSTPETFRGEEVTEIEWDENGYVIG